MDFLLLKLESFFLLVFPFIILLGVIIVIHELGHFTAAKLLGVRVEVFSVGFGKKILKYKYGDTLYCISLFLLGGYVKMFGDDPSLEISEENKKYSFLHKPIPSRIIIALAGPIMNFVLACFLFSILTLSGEPLPSPSVGDVRHESAAYEAGFRSGDKIKKINGNQIKSWVQIQDLVWKNANTPLEFTVQREKTKSSKKLTQSLEEKETKNLKQTHQNKKEEHQHEEYQNEKLQNGKTLNLASFKATPELQKNLDISSFKKNVGNIEGLNPYSLSAIVTLDPLHKGVAEKAGFKNFDRILSINGKEVKYFRNLEHFILQELSSQASLTFEVQNAMPEALGKILNSNTHQNLSNNENKESTQKESVKKEHLKTRKEKEPEKRTLVVNFEDSPKTLSLFNLLVSKKEKAKKNDARTSGMNDMNEKRFSEEGEVLKILGLNSTELFLLDVKKDSPAFKAGLKVGDRVLSINSKKVKRWFEVSEGIQSYNPSEGTPINIRVLRGSEEFSYDVIPEMTSLIQRQGTYVSQEKKYILGVRYVNTMVMASPVIVKETNFFKAALYGVEQSFKASLQVGAHIVGIIKNKISPRNLAGVITIGRYASRTFEMGFAAFIKLMALISINLFLINLLPIPLLDGGHILFFTIEGLKGTPISLRKMEIAQQVGFAVLMLLIGLTFFNDIANLFRSPF